jgi:hypothetical protein
LAPPVPPIYTELKSTRIFEVAVLEVKFIPRSVGAIAVAVAALGALKLPIRLFLIIAFTLPLTEPKSIPDTVGFVAFDELIP